MTGDVAWVLKIFTSDCEQKITHLITVCHTQREGKCHCRITCQLMAENNLLVPLSEVTSKLAVRMLSGPGVSIFVLSRVVKKKSIFKMEFEQVFEGPYRM